MAKMSIHRALAELKTLDSRINGAISEAVFVTPNKASNKKIGGVDIEQHRRNIVGSYDKVVALVNRRNAIKTAIVMSNASTVVNVAGKAYTVAEAIERKNSIGYDQNLLQKMRIAYTQCVAKITQENELLDKKFEVFLSSLGGKDQMKSEEVEAQRKLYYANNEWNLIDPLTLKEKIDKLSADVDDFYIEVDSVLSESNAVTFIEVE